VTVDVELDGVRHRLELQRDGGTWLVAFGDRRMTVTVAAVGERWSLLLGTRSVDVGFEPGRDGSQVVRVNGRPVRLTVAEPRTRFGRRGQDAGAAAGAAAISAPMPGRVVKVLVAPGDIVAARQAVVVVEAMKMENELRAPRAGTVREIRAAEGASVEAGATLLVLE
jgi:biotin carboxyl carrier protein